MKIESPGKCLACGILLPPGNSECIGCYDKRTKETPAPPKIEREEQELFQCNFCAATFWALPSKKKRNCKLCEKSPALGLGCSTDTTALLKAMYYCTNAITDSISSVESEIERCAP